MVKKCLICGSLFDRNLGISFHGFPKDGPNRRKWLRSCKVTEKMLTSSSCVCARHFRMADFDKVYLPKKRLLPNVVPSLSINQSVDQYWQPPHTSFVNDNYAVSPPRMETEVDPLRDDSEMMDVFAESTPLLEPKFAKMNSRKDIKIIEVFSEVTPIAKPAPRSKTINEVIDDDIEIVEDVVENTKPPKPQKQGIKIIEVFSEAPLVFKPEPESDEDVQIIEDSPQPPTNVKSSSTRYTQKNQQIDTKESLKMNGMIESTIKQARYVSDLSVDDFSTQRRAKRNLEFAKTAVADLESKLSQFKVENHRLLKKIERFKSVLLYLRNNNLILEKHAQLMVDRLL